MIDVKNFDTWFDVLSWDKSVDEIADQVYKDVLAQPIKDLDNNTNVPLSSLKKKIKDTFLHNEMLLSLPVNENLKKLGRKHQELMEKILLKLDLLS